MKLPKSVFQSQECLNQDEILHYLDGKADDDMRYRVENHLLDCPLCSTAMEGFSGHNSDDLSHDFADIQKAIQARVADHQETPRVIGQPKIWTLNSIAAAVLLLIVSTAVFVYWNAQGSQQDVLAQIDSSSAISESLRSAALPPSAKAYQEGLDLFEQGNYRESLLYFENIYEAQPENSFARFYAGVTALQLGETDKAIEQLTTVRLNDQSYYEQASYYLILAFMRTENKEEVKNITRDLAKREGSYYAEQAREILKTLGE